LLWITRNSRYTYTTVSARLCFSWPVNCGACGL